MHVQPTFGTLFTLKIKPSQALNTDFKLNLPKTLSDESRNQIRNEINGNPGEPRTLTYNTDYVTNPAEKEVVNTRVRQMIQANSAQIEELTIRQTEGDTFLAQI